MIKPTQDNVVIVLEPEPTQTASGFYLAPSQGNMARTARAARVYASGPGYWRSSGAFVANCVKPGDRVLVTATAGQDYSLDLNVPRHNTNQQFEDACGIRGQFRIVREEEIMAILSEDVDIGTVQIKVE